MWITTCWIIILDYLNPMVSVLTKNNLQEEKLTGNRRGACREEGHMKTEAKVELCSHEPRMPTSPTGGRAKKFLPRASGGTLVLVVVQLLSRVGLFATPWTVSHQASLSFTVPQSLLRLMSIELVMPSNISSPVTPFSSCPQSFPPLASSPMSQLFISGNQRTGAAASELVLPVNIQDWFPLGLTGLISL